MARKNVVDFLEEPICYSAFYEEYLVGNKPCLLSDYFTSSWPCRRDWVKDGLPNWKHLCDQYGLLFCKHNFNSVLLIQENIIHRFLYCPSSWLFINSLQFTFKKWLETDRLCQLHNWLQNQQLPVKQTLSLLESSSQFPIHSFLFYCLIINFIH